MWFGDRKIHKIWSTKNLLKILKKVLDFWVLGCYINQALGKPGCGFLPNEQIFQKLEKSS